MALLSPPSSGRRPARLKKKRRTIINYWPVSEGHMLAKNVNLVFSGFKRVKKLKRPSEADNIRHEMDLVAYRNHSSQLKINVQHSFQI